MTKNNMKNKNHLEEKFQFTIDAIPAFLAYVDIDSLKYRYINKQFEKAIGIPGEKIIGKHLEKVIGKENYKFALKYIDIVKEGKEISYERELDAVYGKRFVKITYVPDFDENGKVVGFAFHGVDITNRKNIEAELEERELLYRSLFENNSLMIYITDIEGRILLANSFGAEFFGLNNKSIVGKSFFKLRPDRTEIYQNVIDEIISTGEKTQFEFFSPDNKGDKWLDVIVSPIKIGDETRLQIVTQNITDRKIAEENINKSLIEKDTLLKEIHHRVKNNFQIITSLLNLQSQYIKDEYDLNLYKDTQNRIRAMSMIHEKLYKSDNLSNIDYDEYIFNLIDEISRVYDSGECKINRSIKVKDISLGIDEAIPLALIINELVSNSYKHAFKGKKSGQISLDFQKDIKDNYIFEYHDNGIGFPDDFDIENSKSLGLKLVKALVRQLDGELIFKSSNGAEFFITFSVV